MKLSKLDLSNVVAIAHSQGHLQLLLDLGNELEFIEIPAPVAAFEGLQHLNEIVAEAKDLPAYEQSIAMLPMNSSMANAIGYDSNTNILQIEFHNGAVYQYSDIDQDTWQDLHQADSIGKFFNENVRGKYQYERVDDDYC
ncbi:MULTISPECIES: KTSC domain-containing protein [Fischerella]|uniref:KTSC domain-containing protein n=1 Tax=Fischerella muscicola CCMEE 5323 TaxID=2019572 RepID=A0A2N6JYB4_FISMU|nr:MULTISPECIES: KTSC domain-containing protein [Fischerella]MBD2429716.1 KTSC domain-containing protein [Fischerella sp. FACHB-380]PLZ85822.1 KTSC domain-containing protein [Fischerella muscicola CCMEE 5323]